ncbi:anthranilate synthase component 1 [Thalassotalea sp. Y01]|uniref:anthranilate synthase component 1 n=1 Tax=Thalassotalea sp. Y01 TaxID=2729613 RepID=UPI00145CBE74|nr:anthranilate synthase component 1 [Thalassotalea sp. Y01]NMP17580.1 anthranilate synthase component 1 [Thalassotalea sp. Y01]
MNTNTKHNNLTAVCDSLRVCTQTLAAPYQSDPLALYQKLSQQSEHSLLLESAEISDKRALKSLILVDAHLKIVCNGNQVTITALQQQGHLLLSYLQSTLAQQSQISLELSNDTLGVEFADNVQQLDEMSRLLATNPMQVIRQIQQVKSDDHPFSVFLGGCFSFDLITMSETLPTVQDGENSCPDYVFYFAESLIVIDHQQQSSEIIVNSLITDDSRHDDYILKSKLRLAELQFRCEKAYIGADLDLQRKTTQHADVDIDDEQFCQQVETLKENIRAGDIFQVVPSRGFSLPCPDSLLAYKALKKTNPSPYMFYLKDQDYCLFGASPESALKFSSDSRQVELYPIAGTRPRGFRSDGRYCDDLDGRIELELRNDEKEKAEHLMLVDLARNDIARVSEGGTRFVAELLKVDRYSHVMHLVSRVVGTLQPQLDALHAYQACMNMGTLSGAPKVMATKLIRQIEGKRRGSYGGAVGYLTGQGEMDTCIVIRSAFVQNGRALVQAGAGVVYDSQPQAEADETRQKAQAVLNAIRIANANVDSVHEQGA